MVSALSAMPSRIRNQLFTRCLGARHYRLPKGCLVAIEPEVRLFFTTCFSMRYLIYMLMFSHTGDLITVFGVNFGPAGQRVLIGGHQCFVRNASHSRIICATPPGHNINNQLLVLQSTGGLGFSSALSVSYTQCSPGTFQDSVVFQCNPCAIGSYSNFFSATTCMSCAAGFYSNLTGLSACFACQAGTFSIGNSCLQCGPGTT